MLPQVLFEYGGGLFHAGGLISVIRMCRKNWVKHDCILRIGVKYDLILAAFMCRP
jgi:hypothetical protein